MSYQARVLPPDEWPKLAGTEAEQAWPHFDPATTQVLVVEDADRIVGCWVLLRLVHAECVWIAPDHRCAIGVVKRLVRGMRDLALAWGAKTVLTAALTDDVRRLIGKLDGRRLPGDHYVLPLTTTPVAEGPCRE